MDMPFHLKTFRVLDKSGHVCSVRKIYDADAMVRKYRPDLVRRKRKKADVLLLRK
jgi:hypothetical protein